MTRSQQGRCNFPVKELILNYYIEFFCAGLVGLIGWLYAQFKAIKAGMIAMQADRIIEAYFHYHDRGWISMHGLENVERLYAAYHKLGGNGTIKKIVEDMRSMPVEDRPPEENSP